MEESDMMRAVCLVIAWSPLSEEISFRYHEHPLPFLLLLKSRRSQYEILLHIKRWLKPSLMLWMIAEVQNMQGLKKRRPVDFEDKNVLLRQGAMLV
jgi:hypothetical protein